MTKAKHHDARVRSARFDAADGKSALFGVEARGSNPARGVLVEAAAQMAEIVLEKLRREGKWSPEAEVAARARAARWVVEQEREMRTLGVPPQLKQLFDATTKREAEKLAREMVLTQEDFSRLVFNAHTQLGYHHRLAVREFQPEHHAAMFEDVVEGLDAASAGTASREREAVVSRKTDALFRERKRLMLHTFKRGAKWHAFFFDFNDMSGHGKIGPHVHYLSHRWADVTFDVVVAALEVRHQSLPRGVHVRCDPPPRGEPGRRILVSTATGGIYRTVQDAKESGNDER